VCAEQSAGTRQPHVAQHASFSCMVNFDAIGRYAHSTGGSVMTTHYLEGMSSQTSILFVFCKMSEKLQKCSSAVASISNCNCSSTIRKQFLHNWQQVYRISTLHSVQCIVAVGNCTVSKPRLSVCLIV
jgi:hypothetical protein